MICEFCKEEMKEGATVCPHCRKEVSKPKSGNFLFAAVCVAGVLVFILLLAAQYPTKPRPTAAEITAACDKQFGAGTDGAQQCQLRLLREGIAEGLKNLEANQNAGVDQARESLS